MVTLFATWKRDAAEGRLWEEDCPRWMILQTLKEGGLVTRQFKFQGPNPIAGLIRGCKTTSINEQQMKSMIIASFLMVSLCEAYEPTEAELIATNQALEKWLSVAEGAPNRPSDQAILEMGRGIRKLAREDIYPSPRREETYRAVQQALISIPGHAEYFGNKIHSDEALYESGRGHEVEGAALWDFETLGQLPSPETVKVLGSFLDDEKNRIELAPGADVAPIAANNLLAARAFHSLKIVSPPLQKRPGDYDDIHPWRLWFAQVQAGNRTFRFEGDPNEYNLNGPVTKVVKPVASRPESNGSNPPSQDTLAKPSKLPVVSLVGAIALLIAAIWLAMKKRSSVTAG